MLNYSPFLILFCFAKEYDKLADDYYPSRFTKSKAGIWLEFTEIPKNIDYVVKLTID